MSEADEAPDFSQPVELPIDGALDLHSFRPAEVKDLLTDYLAACQAKGIKEVRVIHGKGIGNMMRTVHAALSRNPIVVSYALAAASHGGMGATIVKLR